MHAVDAGGSLRRLVGRVNVPAGGRPHLLPLAVVLIACSVGQAAVLTQAPLAWISNDSPQYLQLAERMLSGHQFVDAYRTPAYPAMLALLFLLAGGEHLSVVAVFQILLILLATVELYALTWHLSGQRWVAAAVAAVSALNVYATTWERVIMTEALSYWLMVTLFVVLERYLRRGRDFSLVWFALLSVTAILTRPIFLLLPALLLAMVALWSWRLRTLGRRWKEVSLAGAAIYALVLGYMGANALATGYFGVSDASNIDLFARVLRYDMYALPLSGSAGRQYAPLQAAIERHVTQGGLLAREPWGFVQQYPLYRANHLETLGAFSRAEIAQHPLDYVERSLPDIWTGFYVAPYLYAPTSYAPPWIVGLYVLFQFATRAFAFLPLLLLGAGVRLWRQPQQREHLVALALLLAYVELTLMGTTLSYEGFWRLRFPLEWAVTLVGTILLVDAVRALARGLARWRSSLRALSGARVAGN
jgi:hypothetical protein